MAFWRELTEQQRAESDETPPLNDEMLSAYEVKFGIKLPSALVELLRVKNGGAIDNSDFRINGQDHMIQVLFGISRDREYFMIRPVSEILETTDCLELIEEVEKVAGDPSRIYVFDGDGHYYHALDYNNQTAGEPSVIFIELESEVNFHKIAESFADLLAHQYKGDEKPLVDFNESERHRIIVTGGYRGTLESTKGFVEINWKICSHRGQFLVFQHENWGWGDNIKRWELFKTDLRFRAKRLEDEVSEYDVPMNPKCYRLDLQVQAFDQTIKEATSQAYDGRWKNSQGMTGYLTLYSSDKQMLQDTVQEIATFSTGLRRFFK
jgi:hypothetical protein